MALTNDDLQAIASLLKPINNRLDKIESELSELKASQADLKAGQRELKKELREVKDKVNATYELALDAWGQSTENRTWLDATLKMQP